MLKVGDVEKFQKALRLKGLDPFAIRIHVSHPQRRVDNTKDWMSLAMLELLTMALSLIHI